MEDNTRQKVPAEQLYNAFELEAALIKLNRLSHFLEHEKFTRHDVFKRSIVINFHSYFLDNKYVVDGLVKRLDKKVGLLNDIEHKIDDADTKSYIRKIWDDIFTILDLLDEQISKTIRRLENGLNTDFKIDVDEYQKTHLIRELEKTERASEKSIRKGNSNDTWLLDGDLSHNIT